MTTPRTRHRREARKRARARKANIKPLSDHDILVQSIFRDYAIAAMEYDMRHSGILWKVLTKDL